MHVRVQVLVLAEGFQLPLLVQPLDLGEGELDGVGLRRVDGREDLLLAQLLHLLPDPLGLVRGELVPVDGQPLPFVLAGEGL